MAKVPAQEQLIEAHISRYANTSTQATLRTNLRVFTDWLAREGIGHVVDVRSPHFDLYLAHLRNERRNSPQTIRQKVDVMRTFYAYLVETGTMKANPIAPGLVKPVLYRASQEPLLSHDEVLLLITHADDTLTKLYVALAGLEGLKARHVHELKVQDIQESEGRMIILVDRGDGPDAIPVGILTAELLKKRAEEVSSGYLLLPPDPNANNRRKALRRINRAARLAGIDARVTLRILQKSYRAALLASGNLLDVLGGQLNGRRDYMMTLLPRSGPASIGQAMVAKATREEDVLDLLSHAEKLVDDPGITPIAPIVIAGAVLEMVLRHMCLSDPNIELSGRASISSYGQILRRHRLISNHRQTQIEAWGKLRNDAAHGDLSNGNVTSSEARIMINGIALFLTEASQGEAANEAD